MKTNFIYRDIKGVFRDSGIPLWNVMTKQPITVNGLLLGIFIGVGIALIIKFV